MMTNYFCQDRMKRWRGKTKCWEKMEDYMIRILILMAMEN